MGPRSARRLRARRRDDGRGRLRRDRAARGAPGVGLRHAGAGVRRRIALTGAGCSGVAKSACVPRLGAGGAGGAKNTPASPRVSDESVVSDTAPPPFCATAASARPTDSVSGWKKWSATNWPTFRPSCRPAAESKLQWIPAYTRLRPASFAASENLANDRSTPSQVAVKVAVLLFGGVQDPQCKDEFKALQSLAERYQDKGVNIYWVSINSPAEANNDQLKSPCGPAGSVVILRDQNQVAFKRFGGRMLPTIVVLNQQGEVNGQPRRGFNSNSDFVNDLAAVIDGLLNQK